MKRSIDRILTTHVGSLPRPDDLRGMLDARRRGEDYDHRAFDSRLGSAVQETVNEQIEAGLDALVMPTLPAPAPRYDQPAYDYTGVEEPAIVKT